VSPPGHAGVPDTGLIDAVYARRPHERFEQAHVVEQAFGLRKRTRQAPVISAETAEESASAEMENVHGIETNPGVRRRRGANAQHWAHRRLVYSQKAEDQERQDRTHEAGANRGYPKLH
jgi:hypothetical protein